MGRVPKATISRLYCRARAALMEAFGTPLGPEPGANAGSVTDASACLEAVASFCLAQAAPGRMKAEATASKPTTDRSIPKRIITSFVRGEPCAVSDGQAT